jgi:hypothetical protein
MADDPIKTVGHAAISWSDSRHGSQARRYSSDGHEVVEHVWDGSRWTKTGFTAPGDQVSASCWVDQKGAHIRIACTFKGKVVEYASDPGTDWYRVDPAG